MSPIGAGGGALMAGARAVPRALSGRVPDRFLWALDKVAVGMEWLRRNRSRRRGQSAAGGRRAVPGLVSPEAPASRKVASDRPIVSSATRLGFLSGGLDLTALVTFLVGENGTGKSTLVEALSVWYVSAVNLRRGAPASAGRAVVTLSSVMRSRARIA